MRFDTMSTALTFDTTDYAIIEQLRHNGRASNQQIAEALGLTAVTVATRIKRMEDADQLRAVGVADFSALGYNVLIKVAIEVDGRAASEVTEDLSALPEIFAVHQMTGRYDIDALVALRQYADLKRFLVEDLAKVRGIRSIALAMVIDVVKFQFDVAPIGGSG